MNIFISADDKFLLPAKVMLTSFFTNNQQEPHHIYFLYSSMQQNHLAQLEELVKSHGGAFHPIFMDESSFSGFHTTKYFPIMVYFRLLLAHHLPESEDRALWMDVDLIVNDSLDEFYYQDLQGNYLAACRDINGQDRPALFGCPPGTVYVNSGVMLYDAAAMRRYTISDFYRYYQEHRQHIRWQDQDIINGMFAGKIKVWDNTVYNVQINHKNPLSNVKYLRSNAKIIHYIGPEKPWKATAFLDAGTLWDAYYMVVLNKGRLFSTCYCILRRFWRWVEKMFIRPLRVIHGKLHDAWAAAKP